MNLKNVIITLVALAFLPACGGNDQDATNKIEKLPEISVKVAEVGLSETAKTHQFTGRIASEDLAQLSTRVMGQITYLKVEEGDQVAAGQVLARIKSADIQAQVSQVEARIREAEAALKNVKINYNRIKILYDKKSATRKEFDDISTQYEMAKAQVEAARQMRAQAQEALGYAVVTAPFSGVVSKKFASEGGIANPGMPLLAIESSGQYKVLAKVSESEINLFQNGQKVKVNIEAIGQEIDGTVNRVNTSGSYTQSQFEVSIALQLTAEQAQALKSGMFATVTLESGEQKGIAIAQNALVKRGQLTGLYTVNQQGEAMLRWIKTGKQMGEKVEVLSGLNKGESVITEYKGRLQDGQKVKVIN